MANYDENEFKEIIEADAGPGHSDVVHSSDQQDEKPEARCYICGRPESVTGPLMRIQNSISICKDCMQKTFDSMSNAGFPFGDMSIGFGGFPNMNVNVKAENEDPDEEDSKKGSRIGGMPNISMINLSDLLKDKTNLEKDALYRVSSLNIDK